MRKYRKTIDQTSEVDMTPMLDIVFIMLIFFIVTTSFTKEFGVNINRPNNTVDNKPRPINNTVIIKIDEADEVWFADRAILKDSVQANIEVALSNNPNTVILVKIAESAGTGVLVDVVDQVKLAGIAQVTVAKI